MTKSFIPGFMLFFLCLTMKAQIVYVDVNTGNDQYAGTKESPVSSIGKAMEIIRSAANDISTMKINPGVYILDDHITVATEKTMAGKRIVIEAAILPGDSLWTPEKMPVITSKAPKGQIPDLYHWIVSFLIEESHVTIRGLKFTGYFYPNSRYYPVARLNKTKTDLSVEQCLFVGETEGSPVQVAVIGHGNEIKIDHCIFFKIRNTAVFFGPAEGDTVKHGNSITNSIIYGVNQAVWNSYPDKDFRFENNIVTGCRYVWVKNAVNPTKYSMENCVVVNNKFFTGIPDTAPLPLSDEDKLQVRLRPGEFEITEKNIIKTGQVSLRLVDGDDMALLFGIDEPLPADYMHPVPGSAGYGMGAGLFKKEK